MLEVPLSFIHSSMNNDFSRAAFCTDSCICDFADNRSIRSSFAGANNCDPIQKYSLMHGRCEQVRK